MTENRHVRRRLSSERPRTAVARVPSLHRVVFILLALVALSVQSFVVQAHIHSAAARVQAISLVTLVNGIAGDPTSVAPGKTQTPRDKYPVNEDPSNCPLCQEIVHSGQFVQSAAALAAVPTSVSVHFIVLSEALPSFFAVSHSWRGRAPPRT
jgi:hypothetical protein